MDVLPKFAVFKSRYNNQYLRYLREEGEVRTFLQFSGEEASSPYSKFEIRPATIEGLVHILCCYNNKYWVRCSPNHWWIVVVADELEEDMSQWSCTLFEPIFLDPGKSEIRLRHVQLGHYACLWRAQYPYYGCLFAGSKEVDKDRCDVYKIVDWESLKNEAASTAGSQQSDRCCTIFANLGRQRPK